MTRALLIACGCGASLLTLPAIAASQSFDCAKASTPTENMICSEPEISGLDARMAAQYKRLLQQDAEDRDGVVAVQRRWLIETRNEAAGAAALRQAYLDRLDALDLATRCATPADFDEMSRMEWNRCASISFENSDAELHALYMTLMDHPERRFMRLASGSETEETAALRNAQDAWLEFRDAQCEWETFDSKGGSIHAMNFFGCAQTMTEDRIKEYKYLTQKGQQD